MIRRLAGAASLMLVIGAAPPPQAGAGRAVPMARLPGFAPALAEQPLPGTQAWTRIDTDSAWHSIATSTPETRQAARWTLATGLLAIGRGPDAVGVLDVMGADDPDLALVPAWRRARGVALAQIGDQDGALEMLTTDSLADDPESCLWRMRMLAKDDQPGPALRQLRCAMPALQARSDLARLPFVDAAAEAAVALGGYRAALAWLKAAPDGDPAANLLRGRSHMALGDPQEARLRLERVAISGDAEQRAQAELALVQAGLKAGTLKSGDAMKRLEALAFRWRGDDTERATLRLWMDLAEQRNDTRQALMAGAALFRYGGPTATTGTLLATLQSMLVAALSPGSGLPLDQAAGLFWDYRDLAPAGNSGDKLAYVLAGRLQDVGLYGRAADLLDYQLQQRAQDIETGPLSIRVATLRVLAGTPDRAVRLLRRTAPIPYPAAMTADRHRVEAAALTLLGKPADAMATLQDVPDSRGIASEIYWRERDWTHLIATGEPLLPEPRNLSDVGQAIVLRHAIALSMLGRNAAMERLRGRYAAAFTRLPTAPVFAMLTDTRTPVDPARLGKAMTALPSATPAGDVGDLMDRGEAAMQALATPPPAEAKPAAQPKKAPDKA